MCRVAIINPMARPVQAPLSGLEKLQFKGKATGPRARMTQKNIQMFRATRTAAQLDGAVPESDGAGSGTSKASSDEGEGLDEEGEDDEEAGLDEDDEDIKLVTTPAATGLSKAVPAASTEPLYALGGTAPIQGIGSTGLQGTVDLRTDLFQTGTLVLAAGTSTIPEQSLDFVQVGLAYSVLCGCFDVSQWACVQLFEVRVLGKDGKLIANIGPDTRALSFGDHFTVPLVSQLRNYRCSIAHLTKHP